MKHTKGPWKQGATIAQRYDIFVGQAKWSVKNCGGKSDVEMSANAALIAAAPEMLEALEEVAKYWVPTEVNYEGQAFFDAIGRVQDAINKAKGE